MRDALRLVNEPIVFEEGYVRLPPGPGLRVTLDEAARWRDAGRVPGSGWRRTRARLLTQGR